MPVRRAEGCQGQVGCSVAGGQAAGHAAFKFCTALVVQATPVETQTVADPDCSMYELHHHACAYLESHGCIIIFNSA